MPAVTHVSFSALGGAGAVASRLVAGQRKAGWQADLVTLVATPFPRWAARRPCVAISALADYYLVRKPGRAAFFSLLRRQHQSSVARRLTAGPGVAHLHWLPGLLDPARLLAHGRWERPVVWSLHDLWPMTGGCHYAGSCRGYESDCRDCPQVRRPFRGVVARAFQRKKAAFRALRRTVLVMPSEWTRGLVERSSALGRLPTAVIPNPVDTRHFRPLDKSAVRQTWGLHPTAFTVGVGAADLADPRKRIAETLQVLGGWQSAGGTCGPVQILLFGSGRPGCALPPGVVSVGASGRTDVLAQWYSAMDAYVSLSAFETFGNTLAEAAACGVPSICDRTSGMAEVVLADASGAHVGAPAEIPAVLERWRSSPGLRAGLALAARRRAVEVFDQRVVATQFIELYERLLDDREAP